VARRYTTKEVVVVSTTVLEAAAMATITTIMAAMEEIMVATEVVEAAAMAAITMVLAMMDTVVEMAVMVTVVHLLLAASKISHLDSPHKLQHTLAGMVVAVFLHHRLRAGCLVWLPLLLNNIKVAMAEATTTMVAATTITMEEAMEETDITAAVEITTVEVIAVVVVEEVVDVVEGVMTDIRMGLLHPSRCLSTEPENGSRPVKISLCASTVLHISCLQLPPCEMMGCFRGEGSIVIYVGKDWYMQGWFTDAQISQPKHGIHYITLHRITDTTHRSCWFIFRISRFEMTL
jgi:hypothetical protein